MAFLMSASESDGGRQTKPSSEEKRDGEKESGEERLRMRARRNSDVIRGHAVCIRGVYSAL